MTTSPTSTAASVSAPPSSSRTEPTPTREPGASRARRRLIKQVSDQTLRAPSDCGSVAIMRTPRRSRSLTILTVALCTIALDAISSPAKPAAEIPGIAQRQRTEKKIFTDSEIVEGFLKTAFGAEYHLAGRVDRIRKYD